MGKQGHSRLARWLAAAAVFFFVVVVSAAALLMYDVRNHRIIAEFAHGDNDVVVVMDGKTIPVDVFVDCTNTVFYWNKRVRPFCICFTV